MAARIRDLDWAQTPLGAVGQWPHTLRTAVDMCLGSLHQLAIYWGPELVLLYNDAEIEAIGNLHPWALGRPAREVLAEFWHVVEPMLQRVLEQGEATWSEDQPLTFHRQGALEERYFTWSYSPIPDDVGDVGGVLLVTTDTTERVLQARRLRLLHELAIRMPGSENAGAAAQVACSTLAGGTPDVQFAAIYLADEAGACRLAASAGVDGSVGEPGADGQRPDRVWPLAETLEQGAQRGLDQMPHGSAISWTSEGPRRALALPFTRLDRDDAAGLVVLGLDPLRPFDEPYGEFLALVAAEIGIAIGAADARASERGRLLALEERILGELRTAQARTLAAADDERRRIERDIHDGAQQQIVAVRVKLALAERALSSADLAMASSARVMILESGRELEAALHDLRRLAHGVFPRILADEGLPSALAAAARLAAIPATVEAHGVGRLPVEIESAVYFCCLEALQNAAKHAGPDASVHTRLSLDDAGGLDIEIADDGAGFDLDAAPAGAGLTNMHDRCAACGGTVTVVSAPGAGTRVHASIPVPSEVPRDVPVR